MELLVKYIPDTQGKPVAAGGGPQPGQPFPGDQPPPPGPLVVPQLPQAPQPLPAAHIAQMLPMEALGVFMTMLPRPVAFQTSAFNVDELMALIMRAHFPTQVALPPVAQSPLMGQPQPLQPQYYPGEMGRDDGGYGQKRKYEEEMGGPYGRDHMGGGRRGFQ